jgi:molybdenum cofactor cytidylyltransferase
MRIACLLLAAGAGSRFGNSMQSKQLAMINGKPMVRHTLETLSHVIDEKIFIVLGAYANDIQPIVEDLAQVIEHKDWQNGLGSSIAFSVKHIVAQGEYDGILVALADQLQLTENDFNKLIDHFDGNNTVAAHYGDSFGVPAIFPSAKFKGLKKFEGDNGAKPMLKKMYPDVVAISLPAASIDIDTIADLDRWKRESNIRNSSNDIVN